MEDKNIQSKNVNHEGWHSNTDLGCDVKTILRSDKRAKAGKSYPGLLRLDSDTFVDEYLSRDPHYTFIETIHPTAGKRNPHVFEGRYLTVTRRDDGKLRPNFKPMPKIDKNFNLEQYALGVFNELCIGLGGLVEEE